MKKLLFLLLIAIYGNANAQPGSLDLTFGTGGIVTTLQTDAAYSVAIQNDGKIVVVGNSYISNDDFAVARYNSIGLLDPSFGIGGLVTTSFLNGFWNGLDVAKSVAIQSDGKIVVAGYTYYYNGYDFALARYNSSGSLDTSFGTGGKVATNVKGNFDYGRSVAIQSDGKIVVAGAINNGVDWDFALVRYNINGSIDSTFGSAGIAITPIGDSEEGNSVAIQSDGKIVVAGFSIINGNSNFSLVRYTTIGTLDSSFGIGGIVTSDIGTNYDFAYSLAIQSDGRIVVVGSSNSGAHTDFALVRYTISGSLDASFGTGGIIITDIGGNADIAYSVAMQSDGKIVVAGSSNSSAHSDFALVRYTISGSLDASFGTGGIIITNIGGNPGFANSVAIQSDGKIVVAGISFPPTPGASSDFAVVRYNGDVFLGLAEVGNGQAVMSVYPNPFNSSATIQFNSTINNGELNVFSVFGQKIKTIKNISGQTLTFSRDNLPSGLYLIHLTQENKTITTNKLIITD